MMLSIERSFFHICFKNEDLIKFKNYSRMNHKFGKLFFTTISIIENLKLRITTKINAILRIVICKLFQNINFK